MSTCHLQISDNQSLWLGWNKKKFEGFLTNSSFSGYWQKMQLQMFVLCRKCCLISDKGTPDSFKDAQQHSWSSSKFTLLTWWRNAEYLHICRFSPKRSLKCAFEKRKSCRNGTEKKHTNGWKRMRVQKSIKSTASLRLLRKKWSFCQRFWVWSLFVNLFPHFSFNSLTL